jgi:putative membrane protein (TIGR04086 family)
MVTKQSVWLSKLPKGLGVALAVSAGSTIIGCADDAWLLSSEKIGEGSVGYITMILLLVSSVLGAMAATRLVGEKRLLVCLCAGGVYLLSLLAISALFYGGTYSGVGVSALIVVAGVLSVALLGINSRKKTKKMRR